MDRLLEAGTTLTLGLVGLFAVSLTQRNALLPWIAGVLVCVAAVAYGLTRRRLLNRIAHAVREGSLLQRGLGILASMSVEMVRFGSKAPLLAAITFVAKCMDVAVSFLLYLSFVAWVPLAVLALAQCVHVLTSMVPITPNATGIPYAATAAFLYQVVGVTPEVLAVAIPVRVIAGSLVFWPSLWLGMFVVGRPPRFENQGALFDKLAAGTVLYDYRPEALAKIKALAEAKGAVRRKGPVLVVGCGDGAVGQMLKGDPVVGVEISPRCAALSRDRGLRCALADVVRGLPFAEASFQSVICIDVLHHLGGDWERLFAEFDRVLQRGGTLFLVEPDARNLFVRWTQAPGSPIRVAPWHNEPAIDPGNLIPHLERMGYTYECESFHLEGRQKERSVFPFWQRVLKAPFVLALAYGYRSKPNKFALVTRKPT